MHARIYVHACASSGMGSNVPIPISLQAEIRRAILTSAGTGRPTHLGYILTTFGSSSSSVPGKGMEVQTGLTITC